MTGPTTKRETLRDVAAVMGVVISLVALYGAVSGQTTADAKWQQSVDGRLAALLEATNNAARIIQGRRDFMNDAALKINALCEKDQSRACQQAMRVPE
jgi:hypothetical protein